MLLHPKAQGAVRDRGVGSPRSVSARSGAEHSRGRRLALDREEAPAKLVAHKAGDAARRGEDDDDGDGAEDDEVDRARGAEVALEEDVDGRADEGPLDG